jgi:hypothetical protein
LNHELGFLGFLLENRGTQHLWNLCVEFDFEHPSFLMFKWHANGACSWETSFLRCSASTVFRSVHPSVGDNSQGQLKLSVCPRSLLSLVRIGARGAPIYLSHADTLLYCKIKG